MGHCSPLRPAGAVTEGNRPWYKYHARPHLGAIRQTETEREQTHNAKRAGNPTVKGESFVVPPVVPLSLLQGSFILGCWRGRYFVQYPTSALLGEDSTRDYPTAQPFFGIFHIYSRPSSNGHFCSA